MKNEKLKGKKGKMGKALLLFSFFIFLFLICSCEDPLGGHDGGQADDQPKTGYVTLSLGGVTNEAEGRTIMPSTPNPDDFACFRLWFTNFATKESIIEYRTMADLEDPFELEIGEYELAVTAYRDEERTQPAAYTELKGANNRIKIAQGTGTKYVITLSAIIDNNIVIENEDNTVIEDDGPVQGVFRWIITGQVPLDHPV